MTRSTSVVEEPTDVVSPPTNRAAVLGEAERKMLEYALALAQDKIWSLDGFTDEDQAALNSLRRLAVEAHGTETQQQGDPEALSPREAALAATLREVLDTFSPMKDTWDGPVAYYDGSADIEPDQFERWRAVLDDEPAPVAPQPAATAYGDGKGRVFCLRCAHTVGADVPLSADDVDHWELCPSCGRHVIDVARAEPQPTADSEEETPVVDTRWAVEYRRRKTGEWHDWNASVPDRDHAMQLWEHMVDGSKWPLRLVRRTTTQTIEAEHDPDEPRP
ncbi:hypothetical protein ABZX74_15445 [Streptomyces olivaceoviridis]|uniref:hypothetical protein n=1 Tax=Streptomyces olivaceoviridis TaxID=1921 RepID=UPI0033A53FEA